MKLTYMATAFLLVVALTATTDAQVRFGAKGGISFSTFVDEDPIRLPTGDDGIELKLDQVRDGFAGGGFLTFQLARWFALQPELLYVQKGGETEVLFATVNWKVDYFEIPLLARINIPIGPTSLYLFGGPSLAFNTDSKVEATVFGETYSQDLDITRSTDWNATFGAGFEVPVGNVFLSFDARYTLGLQDIVDLEENLSDDIDVIDIPDLWDGRNGTLLLLLGIGFQVSGR